MTTMFKFIITSAVTIALLYFVFFVKLGDLTLSQHVQGISQTTEAQALSEELEKKAAQTRDEILAKVPEVQLRKDTDDPPATDSVKPLSSSKTSAAKAPEPTETENRKPSASLTRKDREDLSRLIKSRTASQN